VICVGAVLGALLRPHHVAMIGGGLVAACLLGLVVSGVARSDYAWLFGIALMAGLPASGVALLVATVVHAIVRGTSRRRGSLVAADSDQVAETVQSAMHMALEQFRAGKRVGVGCPACRKALSVSHYERADLLVVSCPCNRCRGDFPAQQTEG
jgi:hypothetical protein